MVAKGDPDDLRRRAREHREAAKEANPDIAAMLIDLAEDFEAEADEIEKGDFSA